MAKKIIKNEEEFVREVKCLLEKLADDIRQIKIETDKEIAKVLEKRRLEEIEKIKKEIMN